MLQRNYFSCQNPFEFASIKSSYEKVSLIQQLNANKCYTIKAFFSY